MQHAYDSHQADFVHGKTHPTAETLTAFFPSTCFFSLQGDREKVNGMQVSPLMDRCKAGVSKSQPGFFSIVGRPLFKTFTQVGMRGWVHKQASTSVSLPYMRACAYLFMRVHACACVHEFVLCMRKSGSPARIRRLILCPGVAIAQEGPVMLMCKYQNKRLLLLAQTQALSFPPSKSRRF